MKTTEEEILSDIPSRIKASDEILSEKEREKSLLKIKSLKEDLEKTKNKDEIKKLKEEIKNIQKPINKQDY